MAALLEINTPLPKIQMRLIWHNCKTCPPSEPFNDRLYVTDGVNIYPVMWGAEDGFFGGHCYIRVDMDGAENWWWADLDQTTFNYFKEMRNLDAEC